MRNKIYHNLQASEFIVEMNNMKMYFSSELYRQKFKSRIGEFLVDEVLKFSAIYKISPTNKVYNMIILMLYKKIEKRGFYAVKDDKKIPINYSIEDL